MPYKSSERHAGIYLVKILKLLVDINPFGTDINTQLLWQFLHCNIKSWCSKGVSRIFIMGFPLVRNYRNIFGISSDQLLTI